MWWLLGAAGITALAILVGKCIRFGTGGDINEDYMIGDDDSDWGDKS
jgi:hypothetical protein